MDMLFDGHIFRLIVFLLFCNNFDWNSSHSYTINTSDSFEIITCFLMCCLINKVYVFCDVLLANQ